MFDKRLKALRKENDMTQQELADALNISTSAIGMYEQGRREPDTKLLNVIADFFDVTIDYLLGRADDKDCYKIEKDELPLEVRELGIEYLTVTKELKEKGLSPNEIRDLAKVVNFIKEKNR